MKKKKNPRGLTVRRSVALPPTRPKYNNRICWRQSNTIYRCTSNIITYIDPDVIWKSLENHRNIRWSSSLCRGYSRVSKSTKINQCAQLLLFVHHSRSPASYTPRIRNVPKSDIRKSNENQNYNFKFLNSCTPRV